VGSSFGSEGPATEEAQEKGAILAFNRTDNGNVKPRAVIKGDNSGIIRINQMQVYPPKKLIVVAQPGIHDHMEPRRRVLGVWSYDDNGDVPPMVEASRGPAHHTEETVWRGTKPEG